MLAERLRVYLDIVSGKRVPRFVLASRLEAEEVSRKEHERLSDEFKRLLAETELRRDEVLKLERPKFSYLDLKRELAYRLASPCELCERRCRVDREERLGVCRVPLKPVVASAFIHRGEERFVRPSGTIFFYGCNFRCVFCQNYAISRGRKELPEGVDEKTLAAIADALEARGARNINRVGGEPTPNIPAILGSLRFVRNPLPQIRNSNMYLTPEAMKLIGDLVDLRLPDFKYGNDRCALRYSAALRYREITTRNLLMAKSFSAPGVPSEGIVRHLVLPGHVECCTKPVLERLAKNLSERVVNVMDQYYPTFLVPERYPELNRRITREEFREAVEYALDLGLVLIDRGEVYFIPVTN